MRRAVVALAVAAALVPGAAEAAPGAAATPSPALSVALDQTTKATSIGQRFSCT